MEVKEVFQMKENYLMHNEAIFIKLLFVSTFNFALLVYITLKHLCESITQGNKMKFLSVASYILITVPG